MLTVALFARLEAKPGKENEVAAFRPCGSHCGSGRPRSPYSMRFGTRQVGKATSMVRLRRR